MNTNRMKYASTPTYGMQKRNFFKKAPMRQAPETPDFSKTPEQPISPQQPPFAPDQFAPPMGQTPAAPIFPQAAPFLPNNQPIVQPPYGSQPFFPAAMGMQPPAYPVMTPPAQPRFQPLPLANSAPIAANGGAGFSPRAQGYVPPMNQPQAARPLVQSAAAPFVGGAPIPPTPFPGMIQGGVPQGGAPVQGVPPMQNGSFAPPISPVYPPQTPPMQGMQQPFAVPNAPKPARPHVPLDADKLWSIFLFGLLPLLLIPCLFVPGMPAALRYVFMALCVVGLGGMWYRQMYSSSTRLIVSMVYVALCIVTIVLAMQGGRDARQAGSAAAGQPPAAVQTTPPPANPYGAAIPQEPEPAPTPSPTASGPSQAQRRLETFMTLWQINNTTEMVSLVQPSWASKQDNASTSLFMLLANRTPEEFTIEDVSGGEQDNSRTVTMTALINKNNGKEPLLYRFMVIMVKEGDEWYVDPNSLASNDGQEMQDENVVNNKSVAAATATPRYTVTPAPPADTTLYYNPNGGSFYHLDAYCSSVRSELLPLTGTFPYSDLKTYLNAPYNFQPCLKCGAPTSTLPDGN